MDETSSPDYTFIFEDLSDSIRSGLVWVTKAGLQDAFYVHTAVQDIQLLKRNLPFIPPEIADCIDIASAVYVADKLALRSVRKKTSIRTVIPVRCPEMWAREVVALELQRILYWFTRDNWVIEFTHRTAQPRLAELQPRLISDSETRIGSVEVALWSGGLDSLAGLLNRAAEGVTTRFTLIGTGSSDITHSVQRKIASRAQALITPGRLKLIQVPIRLRDKEIGPTKRIKLSYSQRSRGFVFMLLGAACAYLEGQRALYIYENGIGAINLPFRASETVRDHAVSVNPLSLRRMGNLVSLVIGEPFVFVNPFLLWTKAEMCRILGLRKADGLVWQTVSCDRPRRERPRQCGCCSSCLLRRQALIEAGLADHTPYGVLAEREDQPHHDQDKPRRPFSSTHLQAMLYQVDHLRSLMEDKDPWISLIRQPGHAILEQIVEETAVESRTMGVTSQQIMDLYLRYINEWDGQSRHLLSLGLNT